MEEKLEQPALTPANENPWYVLMTLYGEQTGEEVDWGLHERNRAAWNAWASEVLNADEQAKTAKAYPLSIATMASWAVNRDEVQRLHKAIMLERNGANFNYPGFPDASLLVNLTRLAFDHHLVMQGTIFARGASFYSTVIRGNAWFDAATFCRDVGFQSATFCKRAQFDSATFSNDALFSSAMFSGPASFGFTTFRGQARFDSSTFSGAVGFNSATFSDEVEFSSATFIEAAWFDAATFGGTAGFGSAEFGGDAVFDEATFSGYAYFIETKFDVSEKNGKAVFTDTQFQKPANFRDAVFHSRYPDFSGAVLHDKTAFSDHPDHWPKGAQTDPVQAKASCAVIRHNLGKQGLPEAEHFFYRREMALGKQIGRF